MSDWTKELAIAWEATWAQPHMREGLARLKAKTAVKPLQLPPGYDALVIAASEYHYKSGQQELLNEIEKLKEYHVPSKSLPPPFTKEAREEPT